MQRSVMAFSGGMDSTGLLLRLLAEGHSVYCLSFDYGQKHRIELERAKSNIEYLRENNLLVEHLVADLSSAMGIFHSALTQENQRVPEGHYEEKQMKQTVVPNRNAIFASILYGYGLSKAIEMDETVSIALGVHSGDHAIYPDCRPEFYHAIARAFEIGNWHSDKVEFLLPYIEHDKEYILRDSIKNCEILNLDFDIVFANTNTSYNPDSLGRSSGKSGADVERVLAFHAIGRVDPVEYSENWDTVLNYALAKQKEMEE